MRRLAFALGMAATVALAQLPLAPAPSPAEVLAFLQTMAISPELKAVLTSLLGAGLVTGRATPQVALPLLRQLALRPPAQAEEALDVFRRALERGFIVDTGLTGSSLMNGVLKLLQMGQEWELVISNLRLRYSLLVATQTVLVRYGLVGLGARGPGEPLLPQDRLILELAWAVGDHLLGQPREPMEAFVRTRLVNLRGTVLLPAVVDQLLAALTPEMVQEIAVLAFQPERR